MAWLCLREAALSYKPKGTAPIRFTPVTNPERPRRAPFSFALARGQPRITDAIVEADPVHAMTAALGVAVAQVDQRFVRMA